MLAPVVVESMKFVGTCKDFTYRTDVAGFHRRGNGSRKVIQHEQVCWKRGDSNVDTRCCRVDEIRRHLHEFHFYVQQNPELTGELRARSQDLLPKLGICW